MKSVLTMLLTNRAQISVEYNSDSAEFVTYHLKYEHCDTLSYF